MKKIYLLENTNYDEDADNRIIWSPDDDCEQIHEGYKIIGTYVEQTKLTEQDKLLEVMGEAVTKIVWYSTNPENRHSTKPVDMINEIVSDLRVIQAQYQTYKEGRE
jgi:hypothetical protein